DLPLGALIVYLLRQWSARGFPGVSGLKGRLWGTPNDPGGATVETRLLRMTLDQATGALHGEVVSGRFAGARLDQLGLDQLHALLAECVASDHQSARLLETYLDRMRPGWRDQAGGSGRNDEPRRGAAGARPGVRRQPGADQRRAPPADGEASPGPRRHRLPGQQDQHGAGRVAEVPVKRRRAGG